MNITAVLDKESLLPAVRVRALKFSSKLYGMNIVSSSAFGVGEGEIMLLEVVAGCSSIVVFFGSRSTTSCSGASGAVDASGAVGANDASSFFSSETSVTSTGLGRRVGRLVVGALVGRNVGAAVGRKVGTLFGEATEAVFSVVC